MQNRGTEWARSVFQERRRASRFALISAPCACFFLKALPSLFFFSSRPSLASLPFHFCFSLSLSRLRLSASRSPASSSLSHQPPQQKHLDTTPMNSFIYHHQHSTSPKKKLKTGNQKKNVPAAPPRRQQLRLLLERQLLAVLARPQPLLRYGPRRLHAGRLSDEPARRRWCRSRLGPPRLPRRREKQFAGCRDGRPSPQQGRGRETGHGQQAGAHESQGQERAAGRRQVSRGE